MGVQIKRPSPRGNSEQCKKKPNAEPDGLKNQLPVKNGVEFPTT